MTGVLESRALERAIVVILSGRFRSRPFRSRGGLYKISDAAQSAATCRVNAQTFTHDGEEGRGDGCRHDRFPVYRSVPKRRPLRQSFDQNDAKRPQVHCRGHLSKCDFRRIVYARPGRGPAGLTSGVKAFGRNLQPVIDNQDALDGLETTMQQIPAVEPGKRLQKSVRAFPWFHPGVRGRSRRMSERTSSAYSVTT